MFDSNNIHTFCFVSSFLAICTETGLKLVITGLSFGICIVFILADVGVCIEGFEETVVEAEDSDLVVGKVSSFVLTVVDDFDKAERI